MSPDWVLLEGPLAPLGEAHRAHAIQRSVKHRGLVVEHTEHTVFQEEDGKL